MSDKKKFEAFKRRVVEENERKYGPEIREKYGEREIDQANARVMGLTEERYREWTELGRKILEVLEEAVAAGDDPAGERGRELTELHRRWLSFSWSRYAPAMHCGLAEMYVADERFTAYYDRNVPGCARFLRDAIIFWAEKL